MVELRARKKMIQGRIAKNSVTEPLNMYHLGGPQSLVQN